MKSLPFNNIDCIIFDLGNVIINLDIPKTEQSLRHLLGSKSDEALQALEQEGIFHQYEKGEISSTQFINALSRKAEGTPTEKELIDAWNAMLLDIPDSRFEILKEAQKHYRTFCLSNTNELHISFIYEMLQATRNIENLDAYFEKVYLSHEMGMRKPDTEIFEKLIADNGLIAERTVFIDDTKGHLIGAEKTGLQTFHMTADMSLEQLFNFKPA